MNDNCFSKPGSALFTVEETRLASEWVQKARSLEEEYKDELTDAGDDKDKKDAVIKLIYDEVGPIPLHVKMTMAAGIPIVVEIAKYQKELEEQEKTAIINGDGSWTCLICNSSNTGNFCMSCGCKKPE